MMGWHWMMLACIVTLLTVGAATGDTLVVDDDEGDWAGFTTLQSAIYNASAGDTIRVYDGTYGENVVVNVSVSIVGNVTQQSLVLGDRSSWTIRVEAAETTIEALRIRGGSATSGYAAVIIASADGVTIANCSILDNDGTGVLVTDVNSVDIIDCGIYDTDGHGVLLDDVTDATLSGVDFTDCSLFITGAGESRYDTHSITDCTVNGGTLFYRENSPSVVVPASVGQVILAKCSAVLIRELNITGKGSVGIMLAHCDFIPDLIEIDGCILDGMMYGVYLHKVSNVTVKNSTISDFSDTGITVSSGSVDVHIAENAIDDGLYGIQASSVYGLTVLNCTLDGNVQAGIQLTSGCDGSELTNLVIRDSWIGLAVSDSDDVSVSNVTSGGNGRLGAEFDTCDGLVIDSSLFHNNSAGGLELIDCDSPLVSFSGIWDNSGAGIALSGNGAFITNDTIAGNSGNGIEIDGQLHEVKWCDVLDNQYGIYILETASNLTIRMNALGSNEGYGVYCDSDLENITFLRNNFTDNNAGLVQAYDVLNHTWDDGLRGNWWDDHESVDENADGVWDDPYSIDGPGDAEDRYPLRGAADVLHVALFSDIEGDAVEGQTVRIIVSITVEVAKKDASVRIFREDVVVHSESIDLVKGRNFVYYEWEATVGDHNYRAVAEGRTTDEDSISLTVIPADDSEPETEEGVPAWALAATMLFVSALVVFNLRRFFLPKKE